MLNSVSVPFSRVTRLSLSKKLFWMVVAIGILGLILLWQLSQAATFSVVSQPAASSQSYARVTNPAQFPPGLYQALLQSEQQTSSPPTSETGYNPVQALPSVNASATANPYVQSQIITSPGGITDSFGYSIALDASGTVALIGAHNDGGNKGAAYIFIRNGNNWFEQQKLTDPDNDLTAVFGIQVALNATGDIAAIAAPDVNQEQGAVYVFAKQNTTSNLWVFQQKLTASDAANYDLFGTALSINDAGNVILVGAFNKGGGAAYIFTSSGTGNTPWSQQQKIVPTDNNNNDGFSLSIAVNSTGDLALIGAPFRNQGQGVVYVYTSSSNTWTQQQELSVNNSYHFGYSIALNSIGDTALIGIAESSMPGQAYIFNRTSANPASWTLQQIITPTDTINDNTFGKVIALDKTGDKAFVTVNPFTSYGLIYVFEKTAIANNPWQQTQLLTRASLGQTANGFGVSVAPTVAGDTILVGSVGSPNPEPGVYVFTLANTLTSTLTSAPNPSVYGQNVVLTATVSADNGIATGPVIFNEGSTTLGSALLVSGTATFSTTALSVGSHVITTTYATNYNSQPITQVVNKADTSTSLTGGSSSALAGQGFVLTATVQALAPGSGVPTGTVTFQQAGNTLGVASLDANGQATYSVSGLNPGSYDFSAIYGGNVNFNGSQGNFSKTVCGLAVTVGGLDDGSGATCGTLSFAIRQAAMLTQTTTISITPGLVITATAALPPLVNSNGISLTFTTACGNLAHLVASPGLTIPVGLQLQGNVTVEGMEISGFSSYGVEMAGSGNNNLNCSSIHDNANGVHLSSSGNHLGRNGVAASRNTITSNQQVGVVVASTSKNNWFYYQRITRLLVLSGGQVRFGLGNQLN